VLQEYKTHLLGYQEKRNKKLKFENIDLDFYDDFIKYLKGKKFADNTMGNK